MGSVVAAAWVGALFKEDLVRLWRCPQLRATVRLQAPDCHKTEATWRNPNSGQVLARGDCYYFRLWVENKGRLPAERVEVFAAKLLRKHADGVFREEKSFLPMNLRWSHCTEVFAERISPDMGKHCDLGHIYEPSFRSGLVLFMRTPPGADTSKTLLELDLEVQPNTFSDLLPPGTYRIELVLAAANAAPVRKQLEITLTGNWFADENKMFSDGIGIVELN